MNDTTNDVRHLLDRDDITRLVHRLGAALDEGRFDDLRHQFVPSASARTPGGVAEGREAVVAQAARNHRPDEAIQHVITDVVVDVAGDTARVRANLVVSFAPRVPAMAEDNSAIPARAFVLGEVYDITAVRTDDGWRLARVATTPMWRSGRVEWREDVPTEPTMV